MSMVTSAICEKGYEWQFKTGNDQCETYPLLQPPLQGHYEPIPDGLYEGFDYRESVPYYSILVFRNNLLREVHPLESSADGVSRLFGLAAFLCTKHALSCPDEDKLREEFSDFIWDNITPEEPT